MPQRKGRRATPKRPAARGAKRPAPKATAPAGRPVTPDATPAETPARDRLQAFLKTRRARFPPILRFCLLAGGASVAAMLLILAFALLYDRTLFAQLGVFIGITTVAGGQAAALYAFGQQPPVGVAWILALTLLNMVATLYLVIAFAWRGLERLRETRLFGGVLMSAELLASRHRVFLARWGLGALAVIAALPVQGAGVLGAGLVGILLRVPLRRLVATLTAVGIVVNVVWVFLVKYTASSLPSGGLWDWAPLAVIGLIVAAGFLASRRASRGAREVHVETFGWIDARQASELRAVGIRGTRDIMRVDLRKLAARIGIERDALGRARNVAGLIRLNTVQPDEAVRLTAIGIARIRDLAQAPPELVHAALAESGAKDSLAEVRRWHREALGFVAETAALRPDAALADVPHAT